VRGGEDLLGDVIAEVARTQGVALTRDDPILTVVTLNRVLLGRYVEEALVPATAAIRTAVQEAREQIAAEAQLQAQWMEQVALGDRTSQLAAQQAAHAAWTAELQALLAGQQATLQQVVLQTVSLLRAQAPAAPRGEDDADVGPATPPQVLPRHRPPCWLGIAAAMALGVLLGMALAGFLVRAG